MMSRYLHMLRAGIPLALLLMGVALALPGDLGAQEEHVHADGTVHVHEGLHFSHPIFTESVSPDTKLRFDLARTSFEDEEESEFEVEAEYAFHRSFSVEVTAPYVRVDPDGAPNRSALGTLAVALKFANFAFEDRGILLGYGMEFGLPTGDPDDDIGSDHIVELEPFFNVGLQVGALEVVAWSRLGVPTNLDAEDAVDTEFAYDFSALYAFTSRVQGLVELNGTAALRGEEAGGGVLALGPGIKFAPLADQPLLVGVGASLPIDGEERDEQFRVSVFWHF